MAVDEVALLQDSADETTKEVRYTEVWQVITNSTLDRSSTILADPRLPVLQSPYPGNFNAKCKRRNPALFQVEDSRKVWRVTTEYSTKSEEEDPDDKDTHPLLRPAKWSGSYQQFQSIAEKDRDSNAIVNTVGDVFDPPLMKDDSRPIITCEKNFSSLSISFWVAFRDAINQQTWGVLAAKTVKAMQITWREMYEGDLLYYNMLFSFQINPDGWDEEVLNRGYRQIENPGEDPKQITAKSDMGEIHITEPALLDEAGKVIPKASLPGAEHYVEAKKYQLKDFTTLGIPNPGVKA